jgi:DNA-binding CsgD family transcriptional regulator
MLLVTKYLWINFPESQFANTQSTYYSIFFLAVGLVLIGWIYFFIRLVLGLKEKALTRMMNVAITAGISTIGVNFAIGLSIFIIHGSNRWILLTFRGLMIVANVVFLVMIISLVLQKPNRKHEPIRAFGWMSVIGYSLFFTFIILPEPFSLATGSGCFLALNITPIIWFRVHFLPQYGQLSTEQDQQFLESFFQEYHISNREREIMKLLIQGKSNKDIERMLYISYNTVKNHVYNLFQKLGVNSRWQMLHMVLEARDRQVNSAR